MRTFYYFLVFCFVAAATEAATDYPVGLTPYLQMLQDYPQTLGSLGNWEEGEIEIVTDAEIIAQVEKAVNRSVGVIAQDKYWIWLNDAVRFPNGNYGVYGRIMWAQSLHGQNGVAVLCMLRDGRFALNCNYRHATRSWEIELPRGGASPGETDEEAARREVLEETGMVVEDLIKLGEMSGDSGIVNTIVPVFLARVVGQVDAMPEESEAIEKVLIFTLEELLRGIQKGEVEVDIRGVKQMVKLRDPFLTYALLQRMISVRSLGSDKPVGDGRGDDDSAGGVDIGGICGAVVEDDHFS